MGVDCELRDEFANLFEAFDRVDSPTALFDFQQRLADAIVSAEPVAFKDKSSEEREHIRRLRKLGDGLAWRLIHPYAIRQLAKNPGPAPSIGNQKGFDLTVDTAREIANRGTPAIISDLTNCLRIGDVVICSDREHPIPIECGGHPAYVHKGRKGRQLRRARAVADLLTNGFGRLEGEEATTVTVPISHEAERSWEKLDSVIHTAMRDGHAAAHHGAGDFSCAMRNEDGATIELPDALADFMESAIAPVVGFVTILDPPDPRVPSPAAWSVSFESRLAVLQSEVFVIRAVDAQEVLGDGSMGGRVASFASDAHAVTSFQVEIDGVVSSVSPAFLSEVMFGFETVRSIRDAMIELCMAAPGIADEVIADTPFEQASFELEGDEALFSLRNRAMCPVDPPGTAQSRP